MMRRMAFQTLALWLICSGALAAEHYIKLDGYCDRLKFSLVHGRLVGVSDGALHGQDCDDDLLSGTIATTTAPVTPAGSIVTASTNLGQAPIQFVYYIDLNHGTYALYGTADGNTMFSIAGTWSDVKADDARDTRASISKITDRFFSRAVKVRAGE